MSDPNQLFRSIFYPILAILILISILILLHRLYIYFRNLKNGLSSSQSPSPTSPYYPEFILTANNFTKLTIDPEDKINFYSSSNVQTELPVERNGFIYLEITILELSPTSNLYFGLAMKDVLNSNEIGNSPNSISLHINTGTIHCHHHPLLQLYHINRPPPTVIGLYYNNYRSQLYYTLDGIASELINFKTEESQFYPTIYSNGVCSIQFNFGKQPFKFQWANDCGLRKNRVNLEPKMPPNYTIEA
ncbi:hypothetical protein K502DRAFT_342668 [Neoconidiobolus thromboides FSU 785]|nr:hypothetical protein K502DRAFT_342668 [Neoconidiobolus thromboides FSU 785]